MSIALVAHTSASGSSTFTSSGINTSGATLLVANITYFNSNATGQLTDSLGNTWTALPRQFNSDTAGQLFYCSNPTVGSGHTFTVTNGAFSSLQVAAFSGVIQLAPLDVSAGSASSASSVQAGSVTPTNANSLVIAAIAFRNTVSLTGIGSGFTITDTVNPGSVIAGSLAYLIQTSATAENPTWTLSGSANYGAANAVFIAGSATVPSVPALVASADVQGNLNITTSAIDTTGANLIVINQTAFLAGIGVISDSKGNTWTALTQRGATATQRAYYCLNPAVGSGHTFTSTGITDGSLQVLAFGTSGVALTFDSTTGTTGTGEAQPGSITPAGATSLVITAIAYSNSGQEVIGLSSGYVIGELDPAVGAPSSTIGGGIGYTRLTAATAQNPKWNFSGTGLAWSGTNIVFAIASGQTINASGIPSPAVMGTPGLEYTQDIAATGIASPAAMGLASISGGPILGIGIPSPQLMGTPGVHLATLEAVGIPSPAAVGVPTLNQETDLVAIGIPSPAAMGVPIIYHAQSIIAEGIPSPAAMGTPTVSGGPQRIQARGIESKAQMGMPSISPISLGVQLWIGGVKVCDSGIPGFPSLISLEGTANSGLSATSTPQPLQITSQTIGRWTAIFDFYDPDQTAFPEVDQTFLAIENGVRIVGGGISAVTVDRYEGGTVKQCFHCTAQDWSAILDRRTVKNATYAAGSDIAGIVLDIYNNVLLNPNEGITANSVPPIGGPLGVTDTTEVFQMVSVTQAYNQLAIDTGCIWWVDAFADLHFVDYTETPTCPFSITSNSGNWRALTATGTLLGYGNIVIATSNLTAVPGIAQQQSQGLSPGDPGYGAPVVTETYTLPQAAAAARDLYIGSLVTQFPMAQITRLLLNGSDITDAVYSGLSGFDFEQVYWYFPGFNLLYPPNTANAAPVFPAPPNTAPYPIAGDVLEISYIPIAQAQSSVIALGGGPLIPSTPGLAGTWGSGTFEIVAQVKNINVQGDLVAIANAKLAQSDVVPIQLQFETDEPGAVVGQAMPVAIPESYLPNTLKFTITYIQMTLQPGVLEYGSQFRTVIQATTGQDLGNSTTWQERLVARTENPLPIQQFGAVTFTLAPGGSLEAGPLITGPEWLESGGPLVSVWAGFTTPPTDQNVTIDVLDNGVSILAAPIIIPAGSTAQVFGVLASTGLAVALGDLLTVNIAYQVTGLAPTPAGNGTVQVRWSTAGLPAGQSQPGVYQEYAS